MKKINNNDIQLFMREIRMAMRCRAVNNDIIIGIYKFQILDSISRHHTLNDTEKFMMVKVTKRFKF